MEKVLFLLRLKHWQLFVLMAVVPLLLFILAAFLFAKTENAAVMISGIFGVVAYAGIVMNGWLYSVSLLGAYVYKQLIERRRLNITFLTLILYYVSLELCVILASNGVTFLQGELFWKLVAPFHLLALGLSLYLLLITSRSLKSLMTTQLVKFEESLVFALMLLYLPITVWKIQPKINEYYLNLWRK